MPSDVEVAPNSVGAAAGLSQQWQLVVSSKWHSQVDLDWKRQYEDGLGLLAPV